MSLDNFDEIERLKRELEEVTAERDFLLAEHRHLVQTTKDHADSSQIQGLKPTSYTIPSTNTITKQSSLSLVNSKSSIPEKIRLFRSLFHGREDVYPVMWQNKSSNKIGYMPKCQNEWAVGLCDKFRVKCSDCSNRELAPITDQVIQNHLEGKITIGVYPLLKDDTCHFLATDFDKQTWKEDIAAFCETCYGLGINVSIERSRSGNGGHVWIFFSEAVSASTARNLGCHLLTRTMSRLHQLGMDSYDRLFPNQDTVPKAGFGILIALPLQKVPSEEGNTLFLDDDFKPYSDQWKYLGSIKKLATSTLEDLVRNAMRAGQVLGVRIGPNEDDDSPWEVPPAKISRDIIAGPLPEKVTMVVSNLIFVDKAGLSPSLLNKIKRLAAFQNPEFYKKQKLRLSTALTPRIICCAEDFPKYLGIPLGLLDELKELLQTLGIKSEIVDKSFSGTQIKTTFNGSLTSIQEEALTKILPCDRGVLVAPSGSGKTVMGISIIASRGVNTLILTNRRPLMEQW
jgi:hypothetical protein